MSQIFKNKLQLFLSLLIITALLLPIITIPLRLLATLYQIPNPQAILVLGGDLKRIHYAAEFARQHPQLDLWISDYPSKYKLYERILQKAKIPPEQIQYDFCPTDTVTNFTCAAQKFRAIDIRHVYLITSDYHMRRAKVIAAIVFGSQGIVVTPISVASSGVQPESIVRILRDRIRSILWVATGKDGSELCSSSTFSKFFLNHCPEPLLRTKLKD